MVHHQSTFGDGVVGFRLCSQGQDGEVDGGLGSDARVANEVLATGDADGNCIRGQKTGSSG